VNRVSMYDMITF